MIVKTNKADAGFSFVELLVGLTISSVLLSLVVKVYDANHRLFLTNKAVTDLLYSSQFIIPLLNENVSLAGNTNVYSDKLNNQVDINDEAVFIVENAIATATSFLIFPLITSTEGGELPDTIVVNSIGSKSCTGTNFDYNDGELFHVVDQYYLDGTTLRCKSYDGRYLLGLKSNTRTSYSVSLLENVYDFQVEYGVELNNEISAEGIEELSPEQDFIWVNADSLTTLLIEESVNQSTRIRIRAVNIELVLGVETVNRLSQKVPIKLSSHNVFTVPDNLLIRKFETIIVLKAS